MMMWGEEFGIRVTACIICMTMMMLWKGRGFEGGGVVRGWFTSFQEAEVAVDDSL